MAPVKGRKPQKAKSKAKKATASKGKSAAASRSAGHSRASYKDEGRPTPAEERAETSELQKLALLAAFENCGRITKACEAVGVARSVHYFWLENDAEYKKAFDEADKRVGDLLEDEAWRRAVEGIEEPMIGRVGRDEDGIVTKVSRYSDRLLELLLKGRRPERYKDRRELTGKDGGPLEFKDLTNLSDDDIDAELARLEAEEARLTSGKGK